MEEYFNEDGTRTDLKLAVDYKAMGDSQDLIDSIVSGKKNALGELMVMSRESDDAKKNRVQINYGYLEFMRAKTDWKGNEDWTAIDKAIKDGKAYVG
tara:strand:- start:21 stop:311 length:291 start_codon:yes stop_codon:yes gene_type:complete